MSLAVGRKNNVNSNEQKQELSMMRNSFNSKVYDYELMAEFDSRSSLRPTQSSYRLETKGSLPGDKAA
jgi:hypothetical protein